MLITGGAATVRDLTGMQPVASCLLIGLSPTVYSVFGGIKATILTDYAHTVVLLIIILIFRVRYLGHKSRVGITRSGMGLGYESRRTISS